jgi:hypothetical protein
MSTKKIISLTVLAFVLLGLHSCYKVATVPRNTTKEVTEPVSFAKDIQPLFIANCSMSGCHSPGAIAPDLSPDKAFTSLSNGGYINTGMPETSGIYLWLIGAKTTPMPPGGSNPSNINNLVLAWIQQGAQNN